MELYRNTHLKSDSRPLIPAYYNQYFNPNICHVCKKKLDGPYLKVCECSMISYCSEEHKQIHREHDDLCNAIRKVNGYKLLWDIGSLNITEWVDRKKGLLRLVQAELKRELELYEVQIFLFAKSCFVCHVRPEQEENICKKCYCVNYCNAHKDVLSIHKHCSRMELGLSLDLDINRYDFPKMSFINKFPDCNKHLCNMIEFIKQYVLESEQNFWFTREFVITDYSTKPLTVFYGLTEMQLISPSKKDFVIHVIGANSEDTLNLSAWELLLHLLNFPLKLKVIIIGQKLYNKTELFTYDNVCEICARRPSKLQFEFYSLLYHEYVKSLSYQQPNVIVGFNIKLDESWCECIRIIQSQNCPLILTAKSRSQALRNTDIINKILDDVIEIFYNIKNKFRGYIPHRDSDTELIYFLNKHLNLYKNLRKNFKNNIYTNL